MSNAVRHHFHFSAETPHILPLSFVDEFGRELDVSHYEISGMVLQQGQAVSIEAVRPTASTAVVTFPKLVAGSANYRVDITSPAGTEIPMIYGTIHVMGRESAPSGADELDAISVSLPTVSEQDVTIKILGALDLAQFGAEVQQAIEEVKDSLAEQKKYAEAGEASASEAQASAESARQSAEFANAAKVSGEATLGSVVELHEAVVAERALVAEAKESAETEAYNAFSHASGAKASAEASAASAEAASASAVGAEASAASAGESATMAQEAQSETEALASELDEKFERAVFADNSGNVDISGGLTVSGVASLNGGAVVPETPLWDGAVSNEQVFNYLIDRAERMSPFVTSFPSYIALNSGTLITGESSNSSFSYQGADGSFFFNGSGLAAEAEKLAVFQYSVQSTQATSFYYTKTAFLFVGNPLLNISYLTSEGALAEIVLKNNTSENLFGIRLETKGGKRVATLFCQSTVEEGEISVSSEFVTNGNAFGGSITPEEKWNVLTYVWGGSSSTSAFLRWGNLVMQMPFAMHLINRIQFRTKMGSTKVVMYGGGLACRLATIKTVRLSDATQYMGVKPNSAYLEITE